MSEEMKKRLGLKNGIAAWRHDHRLATMIILAIIASLVLVVISMRIYENSGAAQLDLSRPGYSSVRDQARTNDDIDAFPDTGEINQKTINEFDDLFSRYADEATAVDAFGGDVLNETQLGINAPEETVQ